MNITGNHDIGYAGELNIERLGRWETHFGPANVIHNLSIPKLPTLRIVLFNTLNLDSPATDGGLQHRTRYISPISPSRKRTNQSLKPYYSPISLSTVVLVCVRIRRDSITGVLILRISTRIYWLLSPIKHQNHLSRWASDFILETIFGEHDEGVILGGHDHLGCDVLHRRLSEEEEETIFGT